MDWIGASKALGRRVLTGERYPHICGRTVTGWASGRRFKLTRRQCAACQVQSGDSK